MSNQTIAKTTAKYLLQINAIKLQPAKPYTWVSGWKSPIYCDNRKTLSYPEVRNYIKDRFTEIIKSKYPDVEVIAGVATGAIAHGALVAHELNLPFVYIRSSVKDHGLENQIEGHIEPGNKVVIIEDLISTGGSSLKAVTALREANCQVLGMLAIFSYSFQISENSFKKIACEVTTLSNYNQLIELALEINYIKPEEVDILKKWREGPGNWKGM
ncbi:MAG: orotate phosphoribosyltransferase [Bacteroidia bacterium]|nr:orotate phosphoribosyltransferase [Bacteroidia bacterium]